MHAFTRWFAGVELGPRLRDIERIVADLRPDVVVHEIAELAAPIAATAAGLPLVTVGFGPLLDPKVAESAASAAASEWRARGLRPARWAGLYRDLYVDPCPPALQVAEIADLPAVQPLRTERGDPARPPDWLEPTGPLAYVTFGTIFNRDLRLFRKAIEALRSLPVEAVVTVGANNDPGDLGPQPATIRVLRFVPQATLLPGCSLVISHGGAGTMLGALAFGVPLLLLPQGADQLYNAQRCCAAGAAIMLRPPEATVAAIRQAADRLLKEPGFAERARAVAREMAALPAPDAALLRIGQLAARAGGLG